MKDVLVLGAGRVGKVAAQLLADSGDYVVTLADRHAGALQDFGPASLRRHTLQVDAGDPAALQAALQGRFAVLNAFPFDCAARVAEAARAQGVHYLDLTEDVAATRRIKALAADAPCAFIPQCGLAPGFVSIAAADLARRFERLETLRLRVGALPLYPSNALDYNLTWSTEGLINEYIQPCEAIVDGHRAEVAALEGLEHFSLDGVRYEAFNTSGGLGTLCESFEGRVRELNYRSIRYPGHGTLMKALLHDLRLRERPALVKEIFEHAIPGTDQDVVVVFVTATGWRDGRLGQHSLARKVLGQWAQPEPRSAIQITTAGSACAVLDLLAQGRLPQQGFIRQEQIALDDFLANRFGAVYAEAAPHGDAPGTPSPLQLAA
ncbi:saccharopine dehydrogenase family protein [Azohydromonas caseinilytica]|uniref:Saccharopine dehydrogenase family protein n=1 Tax=Azohydromonas caseinilytica TaxID=2728836 RepID=A0A848FDH0_9BURK|nr:saccharopine dehydrogenase NADP-binding domain-containing protein [Azohydromonas caseinilytica]NML16200.1 saccharopine dehydrogenase family protein [Azohydromonas caseinilytica]